MGKRGKDRETFSRFEVGNHGGCEASLFEFRETVLYQETEPAGQESPRPPERNTVRIAATTFDEALAYLRWTEPAFKVDSVQNQGIIFLISGSPVD
jgi:hypothetical protein